MFSEVGLRTFKLQTLTEHVMHNGVPWFYTVQLPESHGISKTWYEWHFNVHSIYHI